MGHADLFWIAKCITLSKNQSPAGNGYVYTFFLLQCIPTLKYTVKYIVALEILPILHIMHFKIGNANQHLHNRNAYAALGY
jgi:hypothetical protein